MPESMFGRPSQFLLPSRPPASVADPHRAPVQSTPPTFKDFRFNSIGKQPGLLSRISVPQLDHTDYHSPTPSPTPTSPPTFNNDSAFQSKSSRPTLFQQLAGSDFTSMDGDSTRHAPIGQSNGSLASRIQMDGTLSNETANHTRPTSGFTIPPPRVHSARRTTENANLIPPVEVLPQPPQSPPPLTSLAPPLEPSGVHGPTSSTSLLNTTMTRISLIPASPTANTKATSRESTVPSPSVAVDAIMRDLQSSPPAATAIDSLVARQERLQAISANLANLASPLLPQSSQSSSPDLPSATQANDNITPHQSNLSQHSSTPIVLQHPYPANQSSSQAGLNINDIPMDTSGSSLALVPSFANLTQEYQSHRRAVVEAVQNLDSALNAVHLAQIGSENSLALQIRAFEEQRAAFEQTKQVEEAMLQQGLQELQQMREELNTREASLASLEKESKAREVAKRAMLAKRQAQEEERRVADAKRMQEVQEQITAAMKELKEVEALRAEGQLGQLASETVPDGLPTEPQKGMHEEEVAIIKSRNELLRAVKHLRRMHTDKVQKLEESNRTLRRLEVERKTREAEEAERRRIAEEERLRAHAEAEQARRILEEKQRQLEAERKHREIENARLLAEQQAHAEAQALGSSLTAVTSGQAFEYLSHPEYVSASQQQGNPETTGIRSARSANSLLPPEAPIAMNVDKDGRASLPQRPLTDIRTNPRGSQSTTSQSKQRDEPISGGVILAVSTQKVNGEHLPLKPSANPSPTSSSDHVAENALNPATTSPAIFVSAEDGHRSSFPAQLASEFNCVAESIHMTPDRKPSFSRTPKSQTVLDAADGESQKLNIGPVSSLSPTQQNVNLRHLKRSRGRIEENNSGDRSVRMVSVKQEEISSATVKREEQDDQSHRLVQASHSINPPASLPPRPAVIPPPRPRIRKRHAAPVSQTDSSSSYPPANDELISRREAEATIFPDEQPRAHSRGSLSSQEMNAPVQLPVPAEPTNSLLLGPVYPEPQPAESRVDASERPTQDRAEMYATTSSEPASATLSHELDGEDSSRSNRRLTDEHRRARTGNNSRRPSDHHSPPFAASRSITSPTQPHRLVDSWRPQNPSGGPRAEPMRATSPTSGRKRPSEFHDIEHGRRARRQRGDVWMASDHDRDRVDSYRPHRDWRPDSEPDGHRTYRPSPPDRWPHPTDVPRATHDDRSFVPPPPEECDVAAARWEQTSRRPENDGTWYQPPNDNAMVDQHHADDVRVGQTYESTMEERMDNTQSDSSLLTRISDNQRFPLPRGRGRGEPSRGRGDSRGRGRGVARGGPAPALIDRLTSGPQSLGERLS